MTRIITHTHCVVVLFWVFLFSVQTRSQIVTNCEVSENITQTFRSNRETVFSNLRDRSSLGSYANGTAGVSPNTIYGMFLCIGDINRASCSKCVQTATSELSETCNSHAGVFVSVDECMVRFTNFSSFNLQEDPPTFYLPSSADSPRFFNQTLPGKLEELILRVSSSSRIPYFVEDQERVTQLEGSYDLEAMVQCVPDLDSRNCTLCLRHAVEDFFECCNHTNDLLAQIFFPQCIVKYSISDLKMSLGVTKGNEIFGRTFIAIMTALVLALVGS